MRRLPRSTAADSHHWCPGVLPRLLALLAAAAATPWPRDASQVVHDRYDIIFCHPPAGRSLNDRVAKFVAQKPPHKRCYARAPNRTEPIVSALLLNASEVRALDI